MHSYRLFGLSISSEIALPELPEVAEHGEPDVHIRLGSVDAPAEVGEGPHRVDDGLILSIAVTARYAMRGGREIIVDPRPGVPEANVRLYLLGSAMGAILHQRGLFPLHSNAVMIGGKAVAFCGASGSGKSTLAAWFDAAGYEIVADDVCVIRGDDAAAPTISPGLPRLRLWRDAVEALGNDPAAYRHSYAGDPTWEKYDVPLAAPADSERPLGAICVLEFGDELAVQPLSGANAVAALLANIYRGEVGRLLGQGERQWREAVALARRLPVLRLVRPRDPCDTNAQVEAIIAALEQRMDPRRASNVERSASSW